MPTRRSLVLGGATIVLGACASGPLADTSAAIAPSEGATSSVRYPCTSSYSRRRFELTFVGSHHGAERMNETQAHVQEAFSRAAPRVLIVEGFATDEGPSPADVSENARRGESDWARGEGGFATRLALAAGIPFFGGEPTRRQMYDALLQQGYTQEALFGGLVLDATAQSLLADRLQSPSEERFAELFAAVQHLLREEQSLDLPPDYNIDDFYAWYRNNFGVAFREDPRILTRIAPDPATRIGRMHIASNRLRDVHLLGSIRTKLEEYRSVLVVYGGGHLTALSPALADMLVPPTGTCWREQGMNPRSPHA